MEERWGSELESPPNALQWSEGESGGSESVVEGLPEVLGRGKEEQLKDLSE